MKNNKYILNETDSELWAEDLEEEAGGGEHGDSQEVRLYQLLNKSLGL